MNKGRNSNNTFEPNFKRTSQDSSSSEESIVTMNAEKPVSEVNKLVNRLKESAQDILNGSKSFTEEEKRREIFPWIEKFQRQMRRQLGSINIAMLENLVSNYLSYVATSSVECYNKPNRAARLKTMINETLFSFHTIYTEIKQPLEHSSYLDKISELLAFYIDMEIKASRRGKENISKIGSKITTALYTYLDRSQDHILDSILRTKLMMAKCSWELCVPIFNRVLIVPSNYEMSELSFARFIFVFKMWKKCMKKAEDKQKINKVAENRLIPPQNFQIAVKTGIMKGILPKIPKSRSDITMFLMQTKFCVKTKSSAFLKAVSHPIHRVIMNDHKPLFFEDDNDVDDNGHDDQDDEGSCDELMDDILSSLRTKSTSRDLNRVANVVKPPAKKAMKSTKNIKKKKKKISKDNKEISNTGNVLDFLKISPKKDVKSENSFVSKMISRSNLLRLEEKETKQKADDTIIILDEIKTEVMSPAPLNVCSNENVKDLDQSFETPNNQSYINVNRSIEECFIKTEKNGLDPTDLTHKNDLSPSYEIFNIEPPNDTISPTKIEQEIVDSIQDNDVLIDKQNDGILSNEFVSDNFTAKPSLFRESHDMANYDWCLSVCPNNSELNNYQMNALLGPPVLNEEKLTTIDYNDDENIMKNYGLSNYDAQESPVKSIASLQNWDSPKQESVKFLTPAQRKEVLIYDSPPVLKKNLFEENINSYTPLDQMLVSAPMVNESKPQNNQQMTQQSPFKTNTHTTFDSKYLKTTSGLSGFSLDYIFQQGLPSTLDCSQTFENQNKPYDYEPDFNDRVGGITDTDKPASPKNHEVDYFSDFIEPAQAAEIPSSSLSTESGSVYHSDSRDQVNVVSQTEKRVADQEDEKTEGTWIHKITVRRDGYIFLLQQKTRKLLLESVHFEIPPPPEDFDVEINHRCFCDQCKAQFDNLWTNYFLLAHHRKIKAMFGESYFIKTLCLEDEKLFVQMEDRVKDYIIKAQILESKSWLSLPLKKRTAFRHEQLVKDVYSEHSRYPSTPTLSIAMFQNDKEKTDLDCPDMGKYFIPSFAPNPNAYPSKNLKTPNQENPLLPHPSSSSEGDKHLKLPTATRGRYALRSTQDKSPTLPKRNKRKTKSKSNRGRKKKCT